MSRRVKLPPERLQQYLLDAPHPRTPEWRELAHETSFFSWTDVFGNARPVEIEVGFGKGLFLATQGQARPEVSFFGIEIERKYVLTAAARLASRNLANVRLACTDARWFLQARVPPDSVQTVHVFFPDPWWKMRHRKRKVFTDDFALSCVRVLQPGGALHFVSDVKDYFDESCAMIQQQGKLQTAPTESLLLADAEFLTHFERKYRLEGRPIHRACWRKATI